MNILPTDWLTAEQASQELNLPLARAQKLYRDAVAGKHGRVAIAFYQGADKPMLTVSTLLALIGQLPAPTARHRRGRY